MMNDMENTFSYEQAYKNALELTRQKYEQARKDDNPIYCIYEEIFPELRESEDERIRKWIIDEIKATHDYDSPTSRKEVDDALAWLEKQKDKEQYDRMAPIYENQDSFESALDKAWKFYNDSGARTVDGCEDNFTELAFAKGFREGFLAEKQNEIPMPNSTELIEMWHDEKAMLKEKDFRGDEWRLAYNAFIDGFARGTCFKFEKQKEQKPVDDTAFEEWIDDWWKHNKVNNPDSYDKGDEIQFDERGFKNFCRGIRNMYQQKPAEGWTMKDAHFQSNLLYLMRENNSKESWEGCYEWLEELPLRIPLQSKPVEWSEEDEKNLELVIDCIYEFYPDPVMKYKLKDWLQSLRPHWKPSEEQMVTLWDVISNLKYDNYKHTDIIESLYQQLKAL